MKRIQRQRTKGYRLPEGAIYVGRPSPFGNPFPLSGDWITWTAIAIGRNANAAGRRETSIAFYRAWLTGMPVEVLTPPDADTAEFEYSDGSRRTVTEHVQGFAAMATRIYPLPALPPVPDLAPLRGHDLACWCELPAEGEPEDRKSVV